MRRYVAVLATVVLLMAPCASADVRAQQLELRCGTATLTVRNHDGTPLPAAEIKLQTREGRPLQTVACDKRGAGTLKDLRPGSYRVVVARRAIVPFSVNDKARLSSLLIVLPAPPRYAAGEPRRALALPTLLVFIIGGLAVAAGLISPSGSGGGGGHP